MARQLADYCLYTILLPETLKDAPRRGPFTFIVKQRMVTASELLEAAQEAGEEMAVLFGDSRNCWRLIGWGRLTAIVIDDEEKKTTCTVCPSTVFAREAATDVNFE